MVRFFCAERFLPAFAGIVLVWSVSGEIPLALADEKQDILEEQHEKAAADPDFLKQKKLEDARLRLKEIKDIYLEQKEHLREELKTRLDNIRAGGNDREARRLAVQAWKKNEQSLKDAYRTAYSECQKTIADLGGSPGASVRRGSSGPIQIIIGPPARPCQRRIIRRTCPRR